MMSRPPFEKIKSGSEFNNWYWLKVEMIEICRNLKIPMNGSKFQLRDRIMYFLDNDGKVQATIKKKPKSKFNWSKETLSLSTPLTDNVSFGQNFRKFMTLHLGDEFSFNTDFMDWAKANSGKTMQDAIDMWRALENRKSDKSFRRDIADHNMMNQYLRDFSDDNPQLSSDIARKCWHLKRRLPMKNGFVRYEKSDLKLK